MDCSYRALLTGDWQSEWANLDLCKQAKAEVFGLMRAHDLRRLVVLGDLKRAYNPIDARIVKFWTRFIQDLIEENYEVDILLGNHDRDNQYDDKQNWLEILSAAGANVFDEPTYHDGAYFLPYMSNVQEARQALKEFRRQVTKPDQILFFHQDVQGAAYNKLGFKSDAKLTVEDFHSTRYLGCFGGHIHLRQRVGRRVWYVGSPFATDWGEANQVKGYTVVKNGKATFVESKIARWFDTDWPDFRAEDVTRGSRVRVHITCEVSSNYGKAIAEARAAAERKYPGTTIFVKPEFTDSEQPRNVKISLDDSDERKVKAYIRSLDPESEGEDPVAITKYLLRRIEKASKGLRTSVGVKFLSAKGVNFLSFKNVECDFSTHGVTLIEGKNVDRGGSNGAGKTSFLQMLPVALFGTTFKGQKHDRWARKGSTGTASVEVSFRDSRNRLVRVLRTRRPGTLRLFIDGEEHSTGLRSDSKDATQGLIEQITGFTWQTFANAVFIDPTIANTFLTGTAKERSYLLTRFQNLERFELARDLVKKDLNNAEDMIRMAEDSITDVDARIETTREFLASLKTQKNAKKHDRTEKLAAAKRKLQAMARAYTPYKETKVWRELGKERNGYDDVATSIEPACTEAAEKVKYYDLALHTLDHLQPEEACPTCGQMVQQKYLKGIEDQFKEAQRPWKVKLTKLQRRLDVLESKISRIDARRGEIQDASEEQARKIKEQERVYRQLQQDMADEEEVEETDTEKRKQELRELKHRRTILAKSLKAHSEMVSFYEFCNVALSRDGLPAYLNRQLVPVLNREASYFAEKFSDGNILVNFVIKNGRFDVEVINTTGGKDVDDQSTGEKAIAALIASFSAQSVTAKSNILILDEPGTGLDEGSTRRFAQALADIGEAKRYSGIYVTSHSAPLIGELSKGNVITIRKRNGISRVVDME